MTEQVKYIEIVKYDMLDTLNIPLTQWETIVLTALTHPDEVLAQETGMFTEEVSEEEKITFKGTLIAFNETKQALLASQDLLHSWSNSVGKQRFEKFLNVFLFHYHLRVAYSTSGDKHQPESSVLLMAKRKRESSSSSSVSN